jgi:hypothetical protein
VYRIRNILVQIRIRIPGSVPLINLSGYGSGSVTLTNWSGSGSVPKTNWTGSGYGSRKTYGSCGSGSGTLPLKNQNKQSYTINQEKEFYAKTLLYSVRTRTIYWELVGLTWSVCRKSVPSSCYLSLTSDQSDGLFCQFFYSVPNKVNVVLLFFTLLPIKL